MDDEQGVEMIRIVQPEMAIPIHYNDYDVFKSPLDDFKAAVAKAGLTERVTYLSHGDSYEFKSRSARTADIGRGMSPA
jgi:L-ascorbate metabolism protein UlaG (beta-lactamase superfamily)